MWHKPCQRSYGISWPCVRPKTTMSQNITNGIGKGVSMMQGASKIQKKFLTRARLTAATTTTTTATKRGWPLASWSMLRFGKTNLISVALLVLLFSFFPLLNMLFCMFVFASLRSLFLFCSCFHCVVFVVCAPFACFLMCFACCCVPFCVWSLAAAATTTTTTTTTTATTTTNYRTVLLTNYSFLIFKY